MKSTEPMAYQLRLRGTSRLLMEANTQVIEKGPVGKSGDYKNPEEWRSKVYFDEELGSVYFPAHWIKRSAQEAAKKAKLGRDLAMGVAVNPDGDFSVVVVPDEKGKLKSITSVDQFGANGWIHVANGRRPPRTGNYRTIYRPCIPKGWEAEFDVVVFNPIFTKQKLLDIFQLAGMFCGLGGGRDLGFGRFEVVSLGD